MGGDGGGGVEPAVGDGGGGDDGGVGGGGGEGACLISGTSITANVLSSSAVELATAARRRRHRVQARASPQREQARRENSVGHAELACSNHRVWESGP